eukprot:3299907-Pyramimonas_sp.AAC.1
MARRGRNTPRRPRAPAPTACACGSSPPRGTPRWAAHSRCPTPLRSPPPPQGELLRHRDGRPEGTRLTRRPRPPTGRGQGGWPGRARTRSDVAPSPCPS